MRPGNLAEMEDLRELSGLLRRAGWPDDNTSAGTQRSHQLWQNGSEIRDRRKWNPRHDSCRCGKTEEGDETINNKPLQAISE